MTGDRPEALEAADSGVLEHALADALDARGAVAFVHAGSTRDPVVGYCQRTVPAGSHAIGFDGQEWHARSTPAAAKPAEALASDLVDLVGTGTVLTPAGIPHDAALYLESAGFSLESTAVVGRTRATKTDAERERIGVAQTAASAGVRGAAALLDDSTTTDRRLVVDDTPLTAADLRTAVDDAVVAAGGFPAGHTDVVTGSDDRIRPGEPVVVRVAPIEQRGYHGGVVRTFVVDGDGGQERRAHVGVTQAFRSAAALLTADERSVTAVEADLEAEIRAFGFGDDDGIETRVSGVGLESHERPARGSHEIGVGTVVRLDASVDVDAGRVHLADLLAVGSDGVDWFEAPSRSLDPTATLE